MVNRPQIEMTNSLKDLDWDIRPLIDSGIVLTHPLRETDTLQFKINITGRFIFENKGKSIAHVKAIIYSDKYTQDPVIRESLISDELRKYIRIHLWDDGSFFDFMTLAPGDTMTQNMFMPLRHYHQDTLAVIHVFVLYEDEAGTMYDIYYLYKLHRNSAVNTVSAQYSVPDSSMIHIAFDKNNFPKEADRGVTSYIYSHEESQKIKKWIRENKIVSR